MTLQTDRADSLSLTFSALADPTRRAILAKLRGGEAPVMQLAEPFALSLPAVTKHLKVLEKAGLVVRSRDSRWRPSRLEAGPLKEASDWIGQYRGFWEPKLDRMESYLEQLLQEQQGIKEKKNE